MSQKKKARQKPNKVESLENPGTFTLAGFGKKLIGGGVGTLLLGFLVLSYTDSLGRNLASSVSPFLIFGGYAIIALGILWPPPSHSSSR